MEALQSNFEELRRRTDPFRVWLLALVFLLPGLWLLLHEQFSLLTFLVILAGVSIAWLCSRNGSIFVVLLFLFLMGDIRRVVSLYAGSPKLDPLLLVGPLFAIYVALPVLLRLKVADKFSKAVLGLTVVLTLAIFNPRQGPILVGLSGALFFIMPMCWFWIGRQYGTDRLIHLLIYRLLVPIGVLAAVLGIYQTYVGFLPWEQAWIKHALENGYSALYLNGGHIRSFGFSVNSVEYATLLMLSSVCVVAACFSGRRAYALLLPVLLTAQVLASERGAILKLLVSAVIIWAVRGRDMRTWLPRVIGGACVGLALLLFSARQASSDATKITSKTSAASAATSHVTQGLAHPLDKKYSTASTHSNMIIDGVLNGFRYPLGSGLGIVTLGAGKFGSGASESGGVGGSSEVDISDIFITTGFIGGFLYLFTIGVGLWAAARYVLNRLSTVSYALIGILSSMLLAWIPLGQYAIGPFLWLCLGFIAKTYAKEISERLPIRSSAPPDAFRPRKDLGLPATN